MGFLSARNLIRENITSIDQQIKVIEDDDLKKLQQCELSILRDINKLCKDHGLHIMLGGGTLLGAVRHKGFIPWDDDIDLMIMRCEVQAFITLVEEHFQDQYEVQYPHDDYEHYMSFIKIRKKDTTYIEMGYEKLPNTNGVYLDVFIIENVPDQKLTRNWFGLLCNFYLFLGPSLVFFAFESKIEKKMYASSLKGNVLYNLRKFLGFLFSWKSVYEWYAIMSDYFKKYEERNDTKMITIPTGRRHYFGEMLPRSYFQDFVLLPFEDLEVYAPISYIAYLENLYGKNYMELPPVEQREKHCVVDFDFTRRKDS